jgi:hypothetical protein
MSIKDNFKDMLSLKKRIDKSNSRQRQNRGQIVLDSILFDWETEPRHNQMIFSEFFIASQPYNCFNPSQLFPFWKQLSQKQAIAEYVQKMHTLISKMETTEIEHG